VGVTDEIGWELTNRQCDGITPCKKCPVQDIDLRSDVQRRPAKRCWIAHVSRKTEVPKFHINVVRVSILDEYVRWLDVSMYNGRLQPMKVRKC
jgi:hypothetical protein